MQIDVAVASYELFASRVAFCKQRKLRHLHEADSLDKAQTKVGLTHNFHRTWNLITLTFENFLGIETALS